MTALCLMVMLIGNELTAVNVPCSQCAPAFTAWLNWPPAKSRAFACMPIRKVAHA